MNEGLDTLKNILQQINEISAQDPVKYEISLAVLSTLLAQMKNRIPYQFQVSNLQSPSMYIKNMNQIPSMAFPFSINSRSEYQNICTFSDYSTLYDRKRAYERLGSFKWKESNEWKELTMIFGQELNLTQLLEIAKGISEITGVIIDRDAKRRKCILVKWFNENWITISPHLHKLAVSFTEE